MLSSRKYFVFILALMMISTVVLAGCSSQASNVNTKETAANTSKPVTNENTNANTNETAAKTETSERVIEHAMGTTKVEGTPKRVVTLYQGAADVAVALGVKPVGVVESWVEKPMYKYLRDDLEGVPMVGLETQPNLEEIAKLKPDLIIASKLRHEKVYEQLSQIAPTVTHETVFKYKDTVELMGKAMNKEEKANELLSNWDNRVADFKEKISAKLGKEWPIEASVLNFRADHARIYVTGYAGDILGELGFVRSEYQQEEAEKGTVVVKLTDQESIPKMNADVFFLFLSDPGQDNAVQKTYEDWTNHPLWKNLDAVKAGQVYQIDEVAWNMAGGVISANTMLDQLYEHFGLEK
jgi:iron complex transport system substrate-binding protein